MIRPPSLRWISEVRPIDVADFRPDAVKTAGLRLQHVGTGAFPSSERLFDLNQLIDEETD